MATLLALKEFVVEKELDEYDFDQVLVVQEHVDKQDARPG